MMLESQFDRILQKAVSDSTFRELLFSNKAQALEGYHLSADDLVYINALTPVKLHSIIGGMITHRLTPIRIAERFVILPELLNHDPQPGDINIILNSSWAFGNGTNATTELSLASIGRHIHIGNTVLDLGTGTGILSIASAVLGAASVAAYDVDTLAIESARRNIKLNQVENIVNVELGTLQDALGKNQQGWDLVVVNILAPVFLKMLAEGLERTMHPDSRLIVSAIRGDELEAVLSALTQNGLTLIEHCELRSWHTVVARKVA